MLMKIAIGLYCAVGALLVYGGLHYLTLSEFMPYHAQALQADWASLSSVQQGLILSLIKGHGAGAASVGGMTLLLALVGLPRRTAFVFWLLPLFALVYIGFAAHATYYMHAHTHSGPLLLLGPFLGALTVAGAILSHWARRMDAKPSGGNHE